MKISEMILLLEELKTNEGDIDVKLIDADSLENDEFVTIDIEDIVVMGIGADAPLFALIADDRLSSAIDGACKEGNLEVDEYDDNHEDDYDADCDDHHDEVSLSDTDEDWN